MKKGLIIFFNILFLSLVIYGQSPDKMSYQAVIRDATEKLVINQNIGMKLSILQGSESGAVIYEELQTPVTNNNGLVSIQIGAVESSNSFSDISWENGPYFLKSEIDPEGGANYTIIGITQLLSVPYALYSNTAKSVTTEKQTIADVLANMNSANSQIKDIANPTDPHDAVNKEYVTLHISTSGDTLFLGNEQYVVIPNISSTNVKIPRVLTLSPEEISLNSSIFYGNITDNGWDKITEYGFIYSEEEGFEDTTGIKIIVDEEIEKGIYSVEIDSLALNKTYYYKAFASNSKGTSYGEEESFSTFNILTSINPSSTKISDVIGSGYDITAGYANSMDLKSSIMDYSKMLSDGIIHNDPNQNSGSIMAASGSTMNNYQTSMNVNADIKSKYGCFSGEVRTQFEGDRISSTAYSFATESSRQIKSAFCVDRDIRLDNTKLNSYLKPEFKDDIKKLSSTQIIDKYGTDVLIGGMWGGRADFTMSAKKTSASDGKNISAYATAKYNSMFVNTDGSSDVDSKYKSDFQTESTSWKIVARGGVPSGISGKADLNQWQQSINDDNQVFMEYYKGCVVPVTEFIDDQNKKADFEKARDKYIQDKGIAVDAPTVQKLINHSFDKKGFTQHLKGDKNVNTKSGRNTFISASITLEKVNATTINCHLYLRVEEEHSDHTRFSGPTDFSITTDREIVDFPIIKYTLPKQIVSGSHHSYYSFKSVMHCDWISDLQIQFDANSDNDGPYIGMKGTLNFDVWLRDSN